MRCLTNLLFIALVMAGAAANAQTLSIQQDTLVWSVNELIDTPSDSIMTYSCTFVTSKTDRMKWIQKSGAYTTEFEISSTVGNWTNPQTPGSITCHATYFEKSGDIIFSNDDSGVSIRMVFLDNGVNIFPQIFKVTSINQQQP